MLRSLTPWAWARIWILDAMYIECRSCGKCFLKRRVSDRRCPSCGWNGLHYVSTARKQAGDFQELPGE